MSGELIFSVIHSPIPDDWREQKNVVVVQDLGNTDYLADNIHEGTELFVGGFNLGVCVRDHLIALANRQPVEDGRATVYISESNTRSWNPSTDTVGLCSSEEAIEIVNQVFEVTGVRIQISE